MKKIAILVFALGIFAGAGILAVGQASVEEIRAFINRDIKLTWDGSSFVPREDDGSILYPIIYNGRTYLPAKFIAEKSNVLVNWDERTKTVSFVSQESKEDVPYKDVNDGKTSGGYTDASTILKDIPFREFDFEVEDGDREIDVDFEINSNGRVYAKVVLDDKKLLLGNDALDYLLPIFRKIKVQSPMSEEKIVERVLDAFSWNRDVDSIELEIISTKGDTIINLKMDEEDEDDDK